VKKRKVEQLELFPARAWNVGNAIAAAAERWKLEQHEAEQLHVDEQREQIKDIRQP
jgi:hypothetical protein